MSLNFDHQRDGVHVVGKRAFKTHVGCFCVHREVFKGAHLHKLVSHDV